MDLFDLPVITSTAMMTTTTMAVVAPADDAAGGTEPAQEKQLALHAIGWIVQVADFARFTASAHAGRAVVQRASSAVWQSASEKRQMVLGVEVEVDSM